MRAFARGLVAILLGSSVAYADDATVFGHARIVDGDTIKIGGIYVRIWGIDAPELRQDCTMQDGAVLIGEASRRRLAEIVAGGEVICEERDIDRYGRMVGQCSANGVDLGGAMVSDGWAWAYTHYAGDLYVPQQENAEEAGLGLWAGGAVCELASQWRADH